MMISVDGDISEDDSSHDSESNDSEGWQAVIRKDASTVLDVDVVSIQKWFLIAVAGLPVRKKIPFKIILKGLSQ